MPSSESRSERPDPATGVRYAVAGPEALERLLADASPEPRAWRDLYFDTPDGELARRGVRVRVRITGDAPPGLALEEDVAAGEAAAALRDAGDPADAELRARFQGDDPAARALRAMIDPGRLVPTLELETTERVTRRGEARVRCETITARDAELSARLHEVEVVLEPGVRGRKKLLAALEAEHGLLPAVGSLASRARRALADAAVDWLADAVRAARRVAVVALVDGNAALRRDGRALRIPSGEGTGEEAARRVMRETWAQSATRLRMLGVAPGSAHRPATEVWLADGAGATLAARGGVELVSVPLGELLTTVGAPSLRDDATLAALHVLARAGLPEAAEGAPSVLAEGVAAHLGPAAAVELPPGALLNMELSALAFNRRVLALAADEETPLMERVRFLAIFSANLDEFFRVRVAGFKRQVAEGSEKRTLDGATPEAQLDAIGVRARRLMDAAYALLHERLLPALAGAGVEIAAPSALDAEVREWLGAYYEAEVHPVLTPLAAGPGQPFPHIRNLRPALAAIVRDGATGRERLGVVALPDGLPRYVPLPDGQRFIPLEELICARLDRLYPGSEVACAGVFRVTRSAELHLHDRSGEDLLQAVQEEVAQRRFRPVVRLEVERTMPERLRDVLLHELRFEAPDRVSTLSDQDVYEVPAPLDLRGVRELAVRSGPGFTYPLDEAAEPLPAGRTVFAAVRERERLVSFPEDSFRETVERFVLEAADDPDVLAIKLALYRTNRRSRIVEALRRASAAGKQVVALVELRARFDEARNIQWAQYLRRHGIHVIYGMPGVKVHAKIALVVRREADGIRRYAYVGTGNLNAQTATAYTDLGLFSADPALAADVAEVFNLLTRSGGTPAVHQLLVAPFNMRTGFLERVRREAAHARAGRRGHIRAKINGLADRELVAALYDAAQAGVRVELIVRSICVLRPGVPGLSDNIRVISLLGRHLEHARIFRFANGGKPEYLIGSADWRTRNLSRRVEVAAPVRDPEHRARLDALLDAQWSHPRAWELGPDGTYYQRPECVPTPG